MQAHTQMRLNGGTDWSSFCVGQQRVERVRGTSLSTVSRDSKQEILQSFQDVAGGETFSRVDSLNRCNGLIA